GSTSPCAACRGTGSRAGARLGRSRNHTASPASRAAGSERGSLSDPRPPSHDLATAQRTQGRLGKRVDRYVFGKKPLEHRAEQEHAGALERILAASQRDLEAAAERDRPGNESAARDRLGRDRAQALDLARDVQLVEIGVERQQLAQRRGALLGTAVDERQV